MINKTLCRYCFLLGMLLSGINGWSTHIRAGEIIVERIDNLSFTYRFTFIGYRDTQSGVEFGQGVFRFGDATFRDGGTNAYDKSVENLTPTLVKESWSLEHTYSAPGSFTVSYMELNRNEGISNMDNSVNTAFYVETLVIIDPFFGVNNSPIFTVPPIDEATPGVRFVHNPGAFDPDGDSIAYKYELRIGNEVTTVIPKQSVDLEVTNYLELDNPEFYTDPARGSENGGLPEIFMDEINGDLIWDAPGDIYNLASPQCPVGISQCSEYNIAFRVEEYRNVFGRWYLLGYVVRDMQITVYEGDNEKPIIEAPPEICVTAGDNINQTIQGSDPDGHRVKLEAFGGPFEINSPATFTPDPADFQGPPGFLEFDWNTVCGHVRARPYEVQLKVTDNPIENGVKVGPALVEFETWDITVVGPAPTGLNISANSARSITLDWDEYSCNNASNMEIWRRVGDFSIAADACETGMPGGTGYRLIKILPIDDLSTQDTGLAPGGKYCYRIVAKYPAPGRGESYVSEEVCITLRGDAPVMTNVNINATGTEGEAMINWTPPIEIDAVQFPAPYTYNILRSPGFTFNEPELISENISDTFYVDTGINTQDNGFSYQLALFDGNGNFVDSSAVASSVRLEARSLLQSIELIWTAETPWSNNTEEFPYHYIYRDRVLGDESALVLIDSAELANGGFRYLDDGRFNNQSLDNELEYCYYVTTFGSYGNPIIPEPLVNDSQVICTQPNDNIPPCAPINVSAANNFNCADVVATLSCSERSYENTIVWETDVSMACDDDISYYKIYFSSTGLEEDYALIDSTSFTDFTHAGLPSFKGCYKISAVDRSLNESPLSEALCIDNCPTYFLPNVFTPNADGYNDTFAPYFNPASNPIEGFDNGNCSRFILSVDFKVHDRVGKEVFDLAKEDEQSIMINWDGKTNNGTELPAGIYYYIAEVKFDVLPTSNDSKTYKGWVQLLR